MTEDIYSKKTRTVHWILASLIFITFPLGIFMGRSEMSALKLSLYKVHIIIGTLIFIFAAYRLYLKFTEKDRPGEPEHLANYSRQIQKVTFPILYYFPLLLMVSGLTIIFTTGLFPVLTGSGDDIPAGIVDLTVGRSHLIGGLVLVLTAVTHFIGSTLYQLSKGELYARMGLNILKFNK